MNFFFDRCMSCRLARMIDIFDLDHAVRHHDDDGRFDEHTEDIAWIQALAADPTPWIVVSGDGRILKNRAERAALDEAGLTFFCMNKQWMSMGIHDYAWRFVKVWPEIVR